MKSILLLTFTLSLVLITQGQEYHPRADSKNAKILQEARYLQGGSHGAAYVQDDGTEFKEETDADGTRKGSYSYIDDTGKKITVQYTAGKMGFMVSGDHLPKAPQPIPVQASAIQPHQQQYRPEVPSQYTANPRFNTIPQQQVPQQGHFGYNFRGSPNQYQQEGQEVNNLEYHNNNNQFGPFPAGQFQGIQEPTAFTTPQPHRYFPPGKVNLNRTPDGFQYSFSSK